MNKLYLRDKINKWGIKPIFTLFRTFYFLMFWSLVPGVIMVVSCLYMCICSKLVFTGDDGHMRIICCGKAVSGITFRKTSRDSRLEFIMSTENQIWSFKNILFICIFCVSKSKIIQPYSSCVCEVNKIICDLCTVIKSAYDLKWSFCSCPFRWK